jgi:hypothetical protein
VPYLIDALVTYGTVASMRAPALSGVLDANTIYPTPGPKLNDADVSPRGQIAGASSMPVSMGVDANGSGQPLAGAGTVNLPGQIGGQTAQAFTPNSNGTSSCQTSSGSSGSANVLTESDLYDPPHKKCGKHDKPLQGYVDHPEVLDALLKITDQPHPGYGFNQDRWRSWWANEKTNRDLQKPAVPDRVVSGGRTVD